MNPFLQLTHSALRSRDNRGLIWIMRIGLVILPSVVFVSLSCAVQGGAPGVVSPTGSPSSSWFCYGFTDDDGRTTACDRTADSCETDRQNEGRDATSKPDAKCAPAASAWCFDLKGEEDCFAEQAQCARELAEENPSGTCTQR